LLDLDLLHRHSDDTMALVCKGRRQKLELTRKVLVDK